MKLVNIFLLCFAFVASLESHDLMLFPTKSKGRFDEECLYHLKNVFGVDSFIETGTFFGDTTILASEIFKSVYTVELSQNLYQKAKARFREFKNIKSYQGDSADFLKYILPQINEPSLVLLDAHWSDGVTAKGIDNTPVIRELSALIDNGRQDHIILIDDLRYFQPKDIVDKQAAISSHNDGIYDYPSIEEIINLASNVFKDAHFLVYGDMGILFDASLYNINVSDVINAMTFIKKNDCNLVHCSLQDFADCYKNIELAQGSEFKALEFLAEFMGPQVYVADYKVWLKIAKNKTCTTEDLKFFDKLKQKVIGKYVL